MPIDPDDYYMRGETQVYRRPGSVVAGMVVDHLRFAIGASPEFTIDVATGVTLVIWAWVVVEANTDLFYNVQVDGVDVGPNTNFLNPVVDDMQFPIAVSAHKAGLAAGSHTVAIVSDGAPPGLGGGITVWHVPDALFRSQVNT